MLTDVFTSIVTTGNRFYGAPHSASRIEMYTIEHQPRPSWRHVQSFAHGFTNDSFALALSIDLWDRLVCHSAAEQSVKVFSLAGEPLYTTPVHQVCIATEVPTLETRHAVLIVDADSDEVYAFGEQGYVRALYLKPPASEPHRAVFFNGAVFVTSLGDATISKYECDDESDWSDDDWSD